MSDTWDAIQEVKNKQSSLRAKMLERKRQRQDLAAEIKNESTSIAAKPDSTQPSGSKTLAGSKPSSRSASPAPPSTAPQTKTSDVVKSDPDVEKKLLLVLCDINLDIPSNASVLSQETSKLLRRQVQLSAIEHLLEKFAAQQLISISTKESSEKSNITVSSLDLSKLSAVSNELIGSKSDDGESKKRKRESDVVLEEVPVSKQSKASTGASDPPTDSIESLLSTHSAKERENKKLSEEILTLLSKPTAKEQSLVERFRSQGGQLQEFCPCGTREECTKTNGTRPPCKKLHFRKIIHKHTDENLGDCSFLNTCFHMDTCKYVHYEINYPERQLDTASRKESALASKLTDSTNDVTMYPSQWVQCDLRYFDMSVLGKCAVVMADPPWDIHMELPYGTMQDDEMRKLDVPGLQDDGFLFLWVTGRAMELGRECLELWGYKRIDELIWVKTNQLQRIIRTGRTGHWLNHGKEHCLVGVKGNPKGVNTGLDCDVIVAEVRATSHKPDEIYGIIERLSPGTRKVELFGRPHNVQPNWITLGNQVEGVKLLDPDIVKSFKERYPDGNCLAPPKHR